MSKVIFGTNITLDGCCDHTKLTGYDDIHEYFTDLMRDADLMAYGRKTYELMVPYWPDVAKNNSGETKAVKEFAQTFAAIKKIVFSQSLEVVEDEHTRIVRAKPEDELRKLKQEQGKNILLGGVTIPSQLMALGLVDEYHFMVHPVIVGEGTRLLEGLNLPERLQLKLVGTKTLGSGCVALHYLKQ